MKVEDTAIPGVRLLTPARIADERGFFAESWNRARLAEAGIDIDFVQDNHSLSLRKGTVRGLHFQAPPHAQAKLVRCGRGALLDVAVDIRRGSPAYGQWVAAELSFDNGRQMLIPEGCAHGFATLRDETEVIYKCSAYYAPGSDRALQFDDPEIGIDWGVTRAGAVLSAKDAAAPPLRDLDSPFTWEGAA
ncbi:MAG: dTDP-4-dehydrorhamnose 3,5-epimerase [Paracoccaceae bacterium]